MFLWLCCLFWCFCGCVFLLRFGCGCVFVVVVELLSWSCFSVFGGIIRLAFTFVVETCLRALVVYALQSNANWVTVVLTVHSSLNYDRSMSV